MTESGTDYNDYIADVLDKITKGKAVARHLACKAQGQYKIIKETSSEVSQQQEKKIKEAVPNCEISEEAKSDASHIEVLKLQGEVKKLQTKVEESAKKLKDTETALRERDEKIKENEGTLERITTERDDLKSRYRKLDAGKDKVDEELSTLKESAAKQAKHDHGDNKEKQEFLRANARKTNEIDDLKIQNVKLKEEVDLCKERLSRRDETIKDFEQKNKSLFKEKENLQIEIKKLLEENIAKQKDIARMKDQLTKQSSKSLDSSGGNTSRALEKQREENRTLTEKIMRLEREIEELKTRLQVIASNKLTSGNPDIADLSDVYRPSNIADQFRQMYDEEWTHAYEDLEKKYPNDEVKAILNLATMLKAIEEFCLDASTQQFERLQQMIQDELTYPKFQHKSGTVVAGQHRAEVTSAHIEVASKFLKDVRKALGIISTGPLIQVFQKVYMSDHKWTEDMFTPGVNAFIIEGVKLVWMMKMQDPPMQFVWGQPGDTIDKNRFTYYTKSGDIVRFSVWPAVALHKDGPLMSKGIVQA